jgi:RimJ/RimL family protein N-acetyltransferase
MEEKLKQHDIRLRSGSVVLRPMAEEDWEVLGSWNSDPEVLRYADANSSGYTLDQVKRIYRGVSQNAFCFIIEHEGRPIGETWLQKMNLERILVEFPDKDIRRIDVMIGEKELWGEGIGTETLGLLVEFGFEQESADAIFGCDVSDYNVRSLKMFQKLGFEIHAEIKGHSKEGDLNYDMILTREKYEMALSLC